MVVEKEKEETKVVVDVKRQGQKEGVKNETSS